MTNINLLLVSAFAYHPRGIFPFKGIQAQHVKPSICHPEQNDKNIKILKHINSISIKLRRYNFMLINFTPRNISEDPRPELHRGRSLKAPKCNYIIFILYFSILPSATSLYFHRFQTILSTSIAIYWKSTFEKFIPRFNECLQY